MGAQGALGVKIELAGGAVLSPPDASDVSAHMCACAYGNEPLVMEVPALQVTAHVHAMYM